MMLLVKQESIEHARFRALAQITIDSEKGVEAFEEYMKIAFPYMEAAKSRDRAEFIQKIQEEVKRGPIVVTKVEEPRGRSRLKTRKVTRQKPLQREEAERIYDGMGSSIPIK